MLEVQGINHPFPGWEKFSKTDAFSLSVAISKAEMSFDPEVLRLTFAEVEGSYRRPRVNGMVPSFPEVASGIVGRGVVLATARILGEDIPDETIERLTKETHFSELPLRVLNYLEARGASQTEA